MLAELNALADALYDRDRRIGYEFYCNALLGKGDGKGTLLVVNGRPREIWVRRSDTLEAFPVYAPASWIVPLRDGDPRIERTEVRIGKAPGIDYYTILDSLTEAGRESTGVVSLVEDMLYQAFYNIVANMKTLRARQTDTASNNITVDGPYVYRKPSTGSLVVYTTTNVGAAVQAAITALSAGQHQLGLVYLDKETNALGLALATAAAATFTLPSRGEFTTATLAAIVLRPYWEPIGAVYLYKTQTSVVEADFYRSWEPRDWFSSALSELPQVNRIPNADQTIAAGYSAVIAYDYELASGRILEIAANGVMEIL